VATWRDRRAVRWLLSGLRIAVCLGLIGYVVGRMSWFDHVHLPDGVRARVVAETDEQLWIRLPDGSTRSLAKASLTHAAETPAVERGVLSVVTRMQVGWAFAALGIFAPVPLVGALRWWMLLRVVGVDLRYAEAIKLTYLGNFFNMVSPTLTGGDLVKAYFVAQHTTRRAEAITVIFVDRAVGLAGLVVVGTAAAASQWQDPELRRLAWGGAGLLLAMLVGGGLLVSATVRQMLRLNGLIRRLPLGETLARVDGAIRLFRHHLRAVGLALALTVVVHLLNLSAIGMAGQGLGLRAAWSWYYVYVPVGLLMAAFVPVPQGLGVLEWAFLTFFARAGQASASQAGLLALASRLIQLIWALPGLALSIGGLHRPSPERLAELSAKGN